MTSRTWRRASACPGDAGALRESALGLERVGLTHFRLAPGFRIPFAHRHEDQEEVYVVVGGSARIKVADE